MPFDFRLPDIGEGVAEGEVIQWFVKEGDAIEEDKPLVSVLTDKANVEIPSPRSGRVLKLHAQVGDKVKVGAPLVTIETEGAGPRGSAASPKREPSERAPGPPAPATRSAEPPPPVPGRATAPAPSVQRTESPKTEPSSAPSPSAAADATRGSRVLATPYVRRLAAERGLRIEELRGTGPGGRVLESDLEAPGPRPQEPQVGAPERPSPGPAAGPTPEAPAGATVGVERVAIRGMRRVIAEHMTQSVHHAAHFTYVEEVDVSELVRLRERMSKHVEKHGVRLSFLPFVIKGVIAGLREHPWMNARYDDEKQELEVYRTYHIGIATAAPDGLIVPVIREAERKSLRDLAKEIQELSERGRAGKLDRGALSGSTFTITSLGALGGVLATPILNYPEVGILGVHKIEKRPVYRPDGSLAPADVMNLSVSLDHRVIDGIVGAQFLSVVKSYLEDPHQLFAELA